MKRDKFAICLLFLMALSSCGNTIEVPEYDVNGVEHVGPNYGISYEDIDTIESLCKYSGAIVKAVYVGREEYSTPDDIFMFRIEEDFTGVTDEEVIHVYESDLSSFIAGKTYYLFLSGYHSPLYPHTVYTRIEKRFLLGESPSGEYTFYNDTALDLNSVSDISEYIRDEIVAKGKYDTESSLIGEPIEDAFENAALVAIGTITAVNESPFNKNISAVSYSIDTVLNGSYSPSYTSTEGLSQEIIDVSGITDGKVRKESIPAPLDWEVGDQLILLLAQTEDGLYHMYSREHFAYQIDSDEAQRILELAGYED